MNTYNQSFVFALALHLIIFIFLGIKFTQQHNYMINNDAAIIHATVVEQQQQQDASARSFGAPQQQQPPRQASPATPPQEGNLQQQSVGWVKREARTQQQREIEKLKVKSEKLKVERIKQQQLEKLKMKSEKLKVNAALIKQQQQQRKIAMQQMMQQQLKEEAETLEQQTKQTQTLVDKYKAMIVQAIAARWIVPQNIAAGISGELLIRVAPGGAVLNVTILRSSGDAVLDRSAQAAIWKASPLPVPADLDLFDNFRELHLTVKPEGIY